MVTSKQKTSAPHSNAAESTAAILAMIGKVAKGYGDVQSLAQTAALAILAHAKEHGDCSKAPALVRALPARERNSLTGWFGIYSPIRIKMAGTRAKNPEDKVRMASKEEQPTPNNRWGFRPFDLKAAEENPWYTDPSGANPIPGPLDTLADFENNILKRLANAKAAAEAGQRFAPTQKDNVVLFADYMIKAAEDFNKAHPRIVAEVNAETKPTVPAVRTAVSA